MKENRFLHRIDKEKINQMPLAEFPGEVIVVCTPEAVQSAAEYLSRQRCVGVDTETRPSFVRGQHFPTALLQIANEQRCYLFQLRQIGFPQELADLFANKDICKVGLAFHDDIRGLQRLRPFEPANCIDIQKIVLQYGILELGLQKIFAIIFSRKISKAQQLTNWENLVLTDEQARYASTDAWATLLIYKELLRTKQLPKRVYLRIKDADHQLQLQHQQEMQQLKQQNNDTGNISKEA